MWATPTMKSISIHALREEGDDHGFEIQPEAAIFLSTPSARRATEGDFLFIGWCCNFYHHSKGLV